MNGTTRVRHATGCNAQPRGTPLCQRSHSPGELEMRAADLAAKRWDPSSAT